MHNWRDTLREFQLQQPRSSNLQLVFEFHAGSSSSNLPRFQVVETLRGPMPEWIDTAKLADLEARLMTVARAYIGSSVGSPKRGVGFMSAVQHALKKRIACGSPLSAGQQEPLSDAVSRLRDALKRQAETASRHLGSSHLTPVSKKKKKDETQDEGSSMDATAEKAAGIASELVSFLVMHGLSLDCVGGAKEGENASFPCKGGGYPALSKRRSWSGFGSGNSARAAPLFFLVVKRIPGFEVKRVNSLTLEDLGVKANDRLKNPGYKSPNMSNEAGKRPLTPLMEEKTPPLSPVSPYPPKRNEFLLPPARAKDSLAGDPKEDEDGDTFRIRRWISGTTQATEGDHPELDDMSDWDEVVTEDRPPAQGVSLIKPKPRE